MTAAAPIDLSFLRNVYARLGEAWGFWQGEPAASPLSPHLRAAVIQSFEFTYELSLRMLRRVLVERATSADLVADLSFNDLLRLGADAGLLADPLTWRRWRAMRNTTSHTYDDAKAQEVALAMPAFQADAATLLQALEHALASP
ncbi:MAG: nucleotidyltransferase [Comamonadaceae bacterium]|nr:MAG: nucleotidyltransferase [Comamonadaceae bacterium]